MDGSHGGQPHPQTTSGVEQRSRRAARISALVLGTGIGLCLVGAWMMVKQRQQSTVRFNSVRDSFATALEQRVAELRTAPGLALTDQSPLALPIETARQLFGVDLPGNVYERESYFHWEPNRDLVVGFPEYPTGSVRQRTNELGMREDGPVLATKPDLRVIVTGDSHTDGSCANHESYCNRIEALLSEAHPGRVIECLNAGKGGYSFHNYAGTLRRLAYLEPDVFVVGVYGGNDFEELLTPWHYFQGTQRPARVIAHQVGIYDAMQKHPGVVAQGLLQLSYFKENPKEYETALTAAIALSAQIAGECRGRGIAPLFVYIPPRWMIHSQHARELFASLGIGPADIASAAALADRWLAALRGLGIPTQDLRPTLSGRSESLYWEDDHINVLAHDLIARELVPRIAPLVEAPR